MPYSLGVKDLLEAGAHYGHQKSRWNPRMRPFIYDERNGVHIINLALTTAYAQEAYDKVVDVVASGEGVLFVATKPQAREAAKEAALKANQYFMTNRWLGGTLTNFRTIRKSTDKIHRYDEMRDEGLFQHMTKKEVLAIERERAKLMENLEGIVNLKRRPGLLFVVDIGQDSLAVDEANILNIPIVALCDTNTDPAKIDYPIPANDDAVRSIRLFADLIAEACIEGEAQRQDRLRAEVEEGEKETLADQFIDAEEEEDLLSGRRVVKKIGKREEAAADADAASAEGAEASSEEAGESKEAEADADSAKSTESTDASAEESSEPESEEAASGEDEADESASAGEEE